MKPFTFGMKTMRITQNLSLIHIFGANLEITEDGVLNAQAGGGTEGTTDYTQLSNKPKINNVELNGNKTLSELGAVSYTHLSAIYSQVQLIKW